MSSPDEGSAQNGRASSDSLVTRVVRWLRAGYPDGVPSQDYVAVLGLLRRTLTTSELERVVQALTEDAEAGQQIMTRQLVEQRIADLMKGPVLPEDVARVSTLLAAAGWPLGSPADGEEPEDSRAGMVGRVVDWLRQGYPTGLPDQDFVPLVALLRRRLTDDEVILVARRLVEDGLVRGDRADIGTAVAAVTSELPSEADIARVQAALASHAGPTSFTL